MKKIPYRYLIVYRPPEAGQGDPGHHRRSLGRLRHVEGQYSTSFFNFHFQVKTKMSTTIMNLHAYEYRYISSQKIIQKYCFIPRFFVKSFNSNTTASALPLLRRKHLVFSRCGGSLVVHILTTRGPFF